RPGSSCRLGPDAEAPAGEGGRQPGSGPAKGGFAPALSRLHQTIGRALERTAALWPDVEQAYRFVHTVAHWLGNPQDESAALVRRRVDEVLGAMQRHRSRAGTLADALDHSQKVRRAYRSGLFHTYAGPGLPRTNNDLEQLFGSQRYHERRATGRKTAAP